MMVFEFLDLKPRNPFLSLAIDEAACRFISRQPADGFCAGIRLWANPESVVLGRTCIPEHNLRLARSREDLMLSHRKARWTESTVVCRRASGGGTVLHGPGNLNYSLYLSLDRYPSLYPLSASYEALLGVVQRSLQAQGISCDRRGLSDLVLIGDDEGRVKKISGNAQFRKEHVLVFHGTLIARHDLIDRISEILRHPPREPEYRAGRNHYSFLGALPESFDLSAFYQCFAREFQTLLNVEHRMQLPLDCRRQIYSIARGLARSTYADPDWIWQARVRRGRSSTPSDTPMAAANRPS